MSIRIKKKNDPDVGRYARQHIFGEGVSDKIRSFGSKVFGKKTDSPKTHVTFAPPQPPKTTASPKKAGDKIVKMLSSTKKPTKKTTQQEINNSVLQIMTGGKIAPQGRKII